MDGQPAHCTILYTDIEGSTALWDTDPHFMNEAVSHHDQLLADAVIANRGRVLKFTGDGVCAVFDDGAGAASAAVAVQLAMRQRGGESLRLKVRIGIHSGTAIWNDGEPVGPLLNEASRLMSAAHGGQTVVSSALASDLVGAIDADVHFMELGTFVLRGISAPIRIMQLAHPQLPDQFPALRARPVDDGLGSRRGSLIGREQTIADLHSITAPGALITIWGPAGIGKTRLAIELARRAGPDFVDGVSVVQCNVVTRDDLLVDAVASMLGVRPRAGTSMIEGIGEALRDRHQLIVLDNCEHVLPSIRLLAQAVISACPGVAIVATSRTPLRLRQEILYPVTPLRTTIIAPEDIPPAAELFVDRVRRIHPGFEVTAEAMPLVSRICQSLDGLPLALELAAARVRGLSLAELERSLRAVDAGLDEADTPADYVHSSLSQAIAWSYDALDSSDQQFFESISIFAGPFSTEAACAVSLGSEAGDVPSARQTLRRLTDRSVVQASVADELVTYQLLDSVRRFGQQRLLARAARVSHEQSLLHYYRGYTASAAVHLRGPDEAVWVRKVDREFANIRQAQALAVATDDIDSAMELMANTFDWGLWRMHYELTSWALDLIRRPSTVGHELFPAVCACAIYGLWAQGNLNEAHRVGARALTAESDLGQPPCPLLRDALASMSVFEGKLPEARRWTDEWIRAARAEQDTYRLARAFYTLTMIEMLAGDVEAAARHGRTTFVLATETGCPTVLAFARHAQGLLLRRTNPRSAARAFDEAAELANTVDNELAIGLAQLERARIDAAAYPDRALGRMRSVILHWRKADDRANQLRTMRQTARLLAQLHETTSAAVLLSALTATGDDVPARDRELLDQLAEALGPVHFRERWAEGHLVIEQELPTLTLELIDAAMRRADAARDSQRDRASSAP